MCVLRHRKTTHKLDQRKATRYGLLLCNFMLSDARDVSASYRAVHASIINTGASDEIEYQVFTQSDDWYVWKFGMEHLVSSPLQLSVYTATCMVWPWHSGLLPHDVWWIQVLSSVIYTFISFPEYHQVIWSPDYIQLGEYGKLSFCLYL